jgi:hypothetical protein
VSFHPSNGDFHEGVKIGIEKMVSIGSDIDGHQPEPREGPELRRCNNNFE